MPRRPFAGDQPATRFEFCECSIGPSPVTYGARKTQPHVRRISFVRQFGNDRPPDVRGDRQSSLIARRRIAKSAREVGKPFPQPHRNRESVRSPPSCVDGIVSASFGWALFNHVTTEGTDVRFSLVSSGRGEPNSDSPRSSKPEACRVRTRVILLCADCFGRVDQHYEVCFAKNTNALALGYTGLRFAMLRTF